MAPKRRRRISLRAIVPRIPTVRSAASSTRPLRRHEFVAPDAFIPRRRVRLGNSVLMPLSVIPLILGVTHGGVLQGIRSTVHARWDAPTVAADPAVRSLVASRRPTRTIPVLVYHGITDGTDKYAIGREQFARQLTTLAAGGYRTITPAQYVAWVRGDRIRLPRLPMLVTFDDGRIDSFQGADAVLERLGFTATMFVEAGTVGDASNYYLNWRELRRMAASGRWTIQEHSGKGHTTVPVDARGTTAPFYANRRFVDGRLESPAQWQHRVDADLDLGAQALRDHDLDFTPLMFAVPFGDVGQQGSNDPTITRRLMASLRRRFPVVFLSDEAADPRHTPGALPRIGVRRTTSVAAIVRAVERMRTSGRAGMSRR